MLAPGSWCATTSTHKISQDQVLGKKRIIRTEALLATASTIFGHNKSKSSSLCDIKTLAQTRAPFGC